MDGAYASLNCKLRVASGFSVLSVQVNRHSNSSSCVAFGVMMQTGVLHSHGMVHATLAGPSCRSNVNDCVDRTSMVSKCYHGNVVLL